MGGGGGGGGVEERKVVDLEDGNGVQHGEGGEEAEAAGSSWEKRMLPKMPVRVLLAEGDDSTRHIIGALLRKCGYRVAAASDGVKAWDILKDNSFNIDLVLTEVELPLMSGFLLLSTIMDHDACKNIPVIMMSSNDSVSMVFKCMLKGAADFLVKPIRKNELGNLWQHVWRKQLANGGLFVQHAKQIENLIEMYDQKTGVSKAEHVTENVANKNMECSEQESDAQSSCTRSELEADSNHGNFLEYKQPMGGHFSKPDHKNTEKNAVNDNLVPWREEDASPRKRTCLNAINHERASRDIELVHIIDNQLRNNTHTEIDFTRTNSQGNDGKFLSIPAHQLELSLRRSDYSGLESQEKKERTLNHSTSSAFSLYNCRTVSSGDAQACNISASHVDLANKNGDSTTPSQDMSETHQPPIRVVPFPVPVEGLTFDGQPFWNGAPVASHFYPHSAPPIWNSKTSTWQGATTQATSPQQNGPKDMDTKQVQNAEEQTARSERNANRKHLRIEIPTDDTPHVSPTTGESGSSTVLDSARKTVSGSVCDSSSNHMIDATEPSHAVNGVAENPSTEGSRHLSQREAALNKFRLKRKDRCFDKKVRYQSRKLLAEQRPRVKGQFVRQYHIVQGS
ncbi:hypothetical protein GUJ93_ZPchr0009g569 [Zizania palustris]|uniref:Two-component response regulator-like APRR9 n=2 Tax=Eukaryota TaxID=2759 RepID=A0A8J5RW14_ZIZPA|nr:hypothetical protein GUJ93_ZPchr0009g569 [Zizania palustris]